MAIDPQLQYYIQQELLNAKNQLGQHVNTQMNNAAGSIRGDIHKRVLAVDQKLSDIAKITESLRVSRDSGGGGNGIVRIEDIPGRRVPFDYFVDIPIANNDTSLREGSIVISQEGPFVAVRRFAVFQSLFQYQVSTGASSAPARFAGRSYGRWRPISSVWDLNDSQNSNAVTTANPLPNGAFIGNVELTSTQASQRSMQFDGRIMVINAGSSFPRQNISIPSAIWSDGHADPAELGCLDFFERGEVITIQVQPNHVNNPPAGNADGSNIFGVAGYPFLAGQFDKQEGIVTPSAFSVAGSPSTVTRLGTDSVSRLPDGILTIGYIGYRIQQPPGV